MRDLEELQQQVIDRRTRPLFADAVKAYGAGALRSAVVSLWIAVLADLIFKIRHLAETGDGAAKGAVEQLDSAVEHQNVPAMQSFERDILKLAGKQLEILSDHEVADLTRLYEDRNRCAHPAFVATEELWFPSSELVRAHLAAAVDAAFSQRPIAGKRLLEVLQRELKGDAWPNSDDSEIRDYLTERYIAHTRQSVRDNLMRLLVKLSVRPEGDDARMASRCTRAVAALSRMEPLLHRHGLDSVLQNWEKAGSLSDDDVKRAVGAFGRSDVFWEVLPRTARARLLGMLAEQDPDKLVEIPAFLSSASADEEVSAAIASATRRLSFAQLAGVIQSSGGSMCLVPAALDSVSQSGSYRDAEARLRVLQLCAPHLQPADIATLREHIASNDYDQIRLAGGTESILIACYEESPKSQEHQAAWHALATFLNEEGRRKPNSSFRYESLCEAVGVDVPSDEEEN